MEFRFSASARIASYIFGTLFFAGGIFLIIYAFYSQLYFVFIGFLLIGIGWYLFKEAKSSCLILNDGSITLINSRSFRTLALSDIQGYRLLDKGHIEILPIPGMEKKMTIGSSFENMPEIKSWLAAHLADVDAVIVQEETEAILSDEHFGISETDREALLQQAKKVTKLLNIASFIVFFWSIIYPVPYTILIIALLVLPLIAFIIIRYFKGLVQLTNVKKSAYPSVLTTVSMLSLILVLRSLLDYNIYNYNPLYKPVVIVLVVALAIAWWCCRDMINRIAQKQVTVITLMICMCAYPYGAVISVNCCYDKAPAQMFAVAVKGKHINKGSRSTSYYLQLDAWGRYTNEEDVDVSPDLYDSENEGDTVNVYLKKGYMGIPWFWVDRRGGQ